MPSIIAHQQLLARLAEGTIVLLDAQAPGWFGREHVCLKSWNRSIGTSALAAMRRNV